MLLLSDIIIIITLFQLVTLLLLIQLSRSQGLDLIRYDRYDRSYLFWLSTIFPIGLFIYVTSHLIGGYYFIKAVIRNWPYSFIIPISSIQRFTKDELK